MSEDKVVSTEISCLDGFLWIDPYLRKYRALLQLKCIDTLFLEIMYQACDPAYADFLGLPLVAWERHTFCISIAHKLHERQMRTGWTPANPDSLSQRDDSLNNILIETQVSNYLKHDFDPTTYPRCHRW